MKNKMTATGEMKIASEEDLLTLDASTSENIYRPFTPEDFRDFETETIHVREVAQRAIDETQWDTGEPGTVFKVLHHTNCILRARLANYRNLLKKLRARAYVTLYNIYDAQVEQLWHQLSPTLTEFVALGKKTQTNLMEQAESCPASVFMKIVRASDPQEEPGMMPADYEGLKSLAVDRMTESMRFVISIAEEIEMWITDLCRTRKVRSAPEEAIIYRYLQKECVYELAKRLQVDGVVAYASDPAAPTAAYVCEKLGLPTSPYTSVEILSQKDLFRRYLAEHNFNVPKYVGCSSYTEALEQIKNLTLPVMIKPVASSGSKGINKLTNVDQLKDFIEDALSYSREKRIIIEEFIEKDGYQISGDAFSVDGILKFHCFGNEYYSSSVVKDFAPLGECWPFQMKPEIITELEKDIQRLISELKMGTTAYNVEAILGKNGKLYILELGARSGGSLIPQITELATGVNMVKYVIKAALGEDCSEIEMSPARGYWSNYMLHSKQTGRFKEISFDENFAKNNLVDCVTELKSGDNVHAFRDAGDALGTLILKYSSKEEMFNVIENMDQFAAHSPPLPAPPAPALPAHADASGQKRRP